MSSRLNAAQFLEYISTPSGVPTETGLQMEISGRISAVRNEISTGFYDFEDEIISDEANVTETRLPIELRNVFLELMHSGHRPNQQQMQSIANSEIKIGISEVMTLLSEIRESVPEINWTYTIDELLVINITDSDKVRFLIKIPNFGESEGAIGRVEFGLRMRSKDGWKPMVRKILLPNRNEALLVHEAAVMDALMKLRKNNPAFPRKHVPFCLVVKNNEIIMEQVPGETMEKLMEKGLLSLAQKQQILSAVCDIVHKLHGAGVVHKDLSPANIVVEMRNSVVENVRLIDFGVSEIIRPDGPKSNMSGTVAGNPSVLAWGLYFKTDRKLYPNTPKSDDDMFYHDDKEFCANITHTGHDECAIAKRILSEIFQYRLPFWSTFPTVREYFQEEASFRKCINERVSNMQLRELLLIFVEPHRDDLRKSYEEKYHATASLEQLGKLLREVIPEEIDRTPFIPE